MLYISNEMPYGPKEGKYFMDIYIWQHYYFYHITKKKENYPEVASEDFLIVSLSNNCNDCNRKSINFLQKYRTKRSDTKFDNIFAGFN